MSRHRATQAGRTFKGRGLFSSNSLVNRDHVMRIRYFKCGRFKHRSSPFFEYERELFRVAFGHSNSLRATNGLYELLTCTTAGPTSTLIRALFALKCKNIIYFFLVEYSYKKLSRKHLSKYKFICNCLKWKNVDWINGRLLIFINGEYGSNICDNTSDGIKKRVWRWWLCLYLRSLERSWRIKSVARWLYCTQV